MEKKQMNTDKYKIEDDVVWVWKDDLDDNYDTINNLPKPSSFVLWEYKECPPEKGGYVLMDDRNSDKTYVPWFQVLPAFQFEWSNMDEGRIQAIMDLPLILAENKRLRQEILELKATIADYYIEEIKNKEE